MDVLGTNFDIVSEERNVSGIIIDNRVVREEQNNVRRNWRAYGCGGR